SRREGAVRQAAARGADQEADLGGIGGEDVIVLAQLLRGERRGFCGFLAHRRFHLRRDPSLVTEAAPREPIDALPAPRSAAAFRRRFRATSRGWLGAASPTPAGVRGGALSWASRRVGRVHLTLAADKAIITRPLDA